ncbi:fibrillin-1-like, partial [Argonauta hians]
NNGKCDQLCINTVGSYRCDCNTGYHTLYEDRYSCKETNECYFNNGNCSHQCTNEVGSYYCSCNHGYTLAPNGHSCILNEGCESYQAPQHAVIKNHLCQRNKRAKFGQKCRISCLKGFKMEGSGISTCLKNGTWSGLTTTCTDINECEKVHTKCSHDCVNTAGSYRCSCHEGYRLHRNGHSCSDINECQDDNGGCEHDCDNTVGSYVCYCGQGFHLRVDNHSCISDGCDALQLADNAVVNSTECTNMNGTVGVGTTCTISCHSGFLLDGHSTVKCLDNGTWSAQSSTCTDINECAANNGQCDQECVNTEGSYLCQCNHGYILGEDNHSCSDVDLCQQSSVKCEHHCVSKNGSYVCNCNPGFTLNADNHSCSDINECEESQPCSQVCSNTPGSYRCVCHSGFTLHADKHTCSGSCDVFLPPTNSFVKNSDCPLDKKLKIGSKCQVQCEKGFQANGSSTYKCLKSGQWSKNNVSCLDIDECEKKKVKCAQQCINTVGSYRCECNDGYTLHPKGYTCTDINECKDNSSKCQDVCVNTKGGYSCKCRKGFTLAPDGHSCHAKFCAKFQAPENGVVTSRRCLKNTVMKVGGRCHVKCHKGFHLPTSTIFTCLKNGTWSNSNATCQDIDECKSGRCDQMCVNTVGSYVCKCNQGYTLHSKGHSCLAEYCEPFPAPVNAEVKKPECLNNPRLHIGTKCSIKCHKGFRLEGSTTLRCLKNGSWSQSNAICEDINECETKKKSVKCDHQCVNTVGSYLCQCNPGYTLNPNGRTCSAIVCNTLSLPGTTVSLAPPGTTVTVAPPGTNVTLAPPGTTVSLAPPGTTVTLAPPGPTVTLAPPGTTVTLAPPGTTVTLAPPGTTVTLAPPGTTVSLAPPGTTVTLAPPGTTVTLAPPGTTVTLAPPGTTVTLAPPGTTVTLAPPGPTVTVKSTKCLTRSKLNAGTKCHLSCPEGYQVQGPSFLECLHNGTWSAFNSTCQDINECEVDNGHCSNICVNEAGSYHCQCPEGLNMSADGHSCLASHCPSLNFPENGQLMPTSCLYPGTSGVTIGTVCKVKCFKGYVVNGTKSVRCLSHGDWSHQLATCAAKTCPKMKAIPHASFEPAICQNARVPVNTFCQTKCQSGYQLVGDARNLCLPSLAWSRASPKCVPLTTTNGIRCPANVQKSLPKGKSYISLAMPDIPHAVNWTVDESWANFKRSSVLFQAGQTVLHLKVTTKTGHVVRCNFTIEAIDEEAPVYRSCPQVVETVAWGKHPRVYWDTPLFMDNVAVVKIKSNKVPEESEMVYGLNQVMYTGRDAENNFARCTFLVNVRHGRCPELKKPKNGFLHCHRYPDNDTQTCVAGCNSYYRFPGNHTNIRFQCNPGVTKWDIPGTHLKDCIEMCKPGSFRSSDNTCRLCTFGSYQNKWEKYSCKQCPAGKTTLMIGARHHRNCITISK